jgi:hypothetical protein
VDAGDPISYLVLEEGTPVLTSDGEQIGTVEHVLADEEADVFDGLVLDVGGGHRFADAPLVDSIHERAVTLTVDRAGAEALPDPEANPAALEAGPDDTVPDDLRDKLKRAWDWISGNY